VTLHRHRWLLIAAAILAGPSAASAQDSIRVERILDSLNLRDRVAQVVMPWTLGNYAAFDDSTFQVMQDWVDSLHVGGIIVSIGSPLDVASKLNRLQERSRLPLLIGADLESGSSFRLIGGTPFPSNMGVAATGSERDAYDIGRITALEGRAVGIQISFAPDADVNNNPANPIINTRSFGENPDQVATLVTAAVKGMQDNGMLATVKHFPGHGDTDIDSHISLPVIHSGWPRLEAVELVPFRAAIAAGVAAVMSAHIALPQLAGDSIRPATLSPAILTGVLRDSLHFHGLAVTDALGMGALVTRYGAGETAVLAFEAGADILLQPADPKAAIDAVTQAVESGRISRERLDQSVRRILLTKLRQGLMARRTVALDRVPEVVGRAEFLATARDIARRSIVLVSDEQGTVDSLRARRRPIALVTYGDENAPAVGNMLASQLRTDGFTVTAFRLWPASGPESYDSAEAILRKNRVGVFAISVKATASKGTVAMPEPLAKLIDQAARKQRTVLVSLGSPYLISQTPHVRSYLLGWSANAVTEWAVASALSGRSDITGRLPISLPNKFPLGYGLVRWSPASPGHTADGQP
jgi:beta-N-acetylhexosaminidase